MTETNLLHNVARLFNIQINLYDGFGRLMQPPPEAILRVLNILGAPVERMDDLAGALRQRRQFLMQRAIDPVVVAWDGGPLRLKLRLPGPLAAAEPRYRIDLESGEFVEGKCQRDFRIKPVERCIEGGRYVGQWIVFPEKLPLGYHRLHLQVGALTFDSYILSSPLQTYGAATVNPRLWGLFCPVYALASEKNWGAGNFSDLETLIDFTGQMGGDFVGTLPLLSTFLDEPFNPSPYAPVSRLFWNEFYLDVTRIPELQRSPVARLMIHSSGFQTDLETLRAAPLIEYRPLMALKRRILEELLHTLKTPVCLSGERLSNVSLRLIRKRRITPRFAPKSSANVRHGSFGRRSIAMAGWEPATTMKKSSSIISTCNGRPKNRCARWQKRPKLAGRRFTSTSHWE